MRGSPRRLRVHIDVGELLPAGSASRYDFTSTPLRQSLFQEADERGLSAAGKRGKYYDRTRSELKGAHAHGRKEAGLSGNGCRWHPAQDNAGFLQ